MSTLYYREAGQGTPLILLHSGGMAGAEWEPQWPLFAKHFRVIAPDQPGHGQSPLTAAKLSIGVCARAVLELLDELAIEQAHWVGSSMGGAVALWLAVHQPERVAKLVLFRASYRKDAATYAGTREMADPAYWRRLGLEQYLSRLHAPQGGPHAWQQVIARVLEAFALENSDHDHSLETLAKLRQPTLLIAGDRDPLVPVEQVLDMYRAIPSAGLWLLPYATHITATNTWRSDCFALEVMRFLQGRGVVRV
jgi:pimeloyl-ACP methyl ester carboxylesterase